MFTSKIIPEIENCFWSFWEREYLQQICFNSILINHEIAYDTFIKKGTSAPVAPL